MHHAVRTLHAATPPSSCACPAGRIQYQSVYPAQVYCYSGCHEARYPLQSPRHFFLAPACPSSSSGETLHKFNTRRHLPLSHCLIRNDKIIISTTPNCCLGRVRGGGGTLFAKKERQLGAKNESRAFGTRACMGVTGSRLALLASSRHAELIL